MSWKYNDYLKEQLETIKEQFSALKDFSFEICDEVDYVKMKFFNDKTIYVVVTMLRSDITLDAKTQPVQLKIMTEKNSLEISKLLFSVFAERYNFAVVIDEETGTFIKQQYSQPVVLSNFNEAAYGFRSVMFMSCTLLMMENLMDIYAKYLDDDENEVIVRNAIIINDEVVKILSFNKSYNMTPNTQPIPPSLISTSVKSLSTFNISFTIPPKTDYTFLNDMASIESGTKSGNFDFVVNFWWGSTHFEDVPMKFVSGILVSGPNQVPGYQISLLR